MKKLVVVVLTITTFAVAPIYGYVPVYPQEIKEACSQVAIEDGVPADEIAAFVADCIALNLKSTEDVGGEDAKTAEEPDLPSSE